MGPLVKVRSSKAKTGHQFLTFRALTSTVHLGESFWDFDGHIICRIILLFDDVKPDVLVLGYARKLQVPPFLNT